VEKKVRGKPCKAPDISTKGRKERMIHVPGYSKKTPFACQREGGTSMVRKKIRVGLDTETLSPKAGSSGLRKMTQLNGGYMKTRSLFLKAEVPDGDTRKE